MTAQNAPEAVDTATRVLDVADRLFRHYGWEKTTVADIARELGMSPANVYRFFPSKIAIVEGIAERMFAERRRMYRAIADGAGSPSERLRRLLIDDHAHTVTTLVHDRKVHEIAEVAIRQEWPSINRHLANFCDVIEEMIRAGIETGEFAPVADSRRTAVCLRQAFASHIHPILIVHCGNDPERAGAEELADFLIAALRGPAGRPA